MKSDNTEYLAQDIYLRKNKRHLIFGNDHIRLQLDIHNGGLLSVNDIGSSPQHNCANISFYVDGNSDYFPWHSDKGCYCPGERNSFFSNMMEVGKNAAIESICHEIDHGRVLLNIRKRCGDFILQESYELWPGTCYTVRNCSITNIGQQTRKLCLAEFHIPWIEIDDADTFEAPGLGTNPATPLNQLPQGHWLEGRLYEAQSNNIGWDFDGDLTSSCIGIMKANTTNHLLCFAYSEVDRFYASTNRNGDQIQLLHRFDCTSWLESGRTLNTGSQCICTGTGDITTTLNAIQTLYESLDIAIPDSPEWMTKMVVYEAHIGPKFMDPFSPSENDCYEPYPHIEDLTQDLTRIADIGFNTLQLMPKFPFPGYTVDDYADIRSHYGDPQALRSLIGRAHQLGIKVIFDVILHGCVDKTVPQYAKWATERSHYLDEHSEWFMRNESGEIAMSFTYAFDIANRDWQNYFIRTMRNYILTLDIDGFRFDAPMWNNFPNWDPDIPYRAGFSSRGALSLFKRMRKNFKSLEKEVVFFTEPLGLALHKYCDLTYSYDELWILSSAVTPIADDYGGRRNLLQQSITAAQMREWYYQKKLFYPQGCFERVIRHIDSHDSFEAKCLGQFCREAFGESPRRAMFSCNALLKGGIMNYVGGEVGAEDFYKQVLTLRAHPAFANGKMLLDRSSCSEDNIFHMLHSDGVIYMLVIINFGDVSIRSSISVNEPFQNIKFTTLLGSDRACSYTVNTHQLSVACQLEAFETVVVELKKTI